MKNKEDHMLENHSKHMWTMALACGGALLLILVLPFFGISKNYTAGIAIAVMIILHVWMMKGHLYHNYNKHKEHKIQEKV